MDKKIAIIGLGYVGLPLAVEFAKKYKVLGFDINQSRINSLRQGHDATLEVSDEDLQFVLNSKSEFGLELSYDLKSTAKSNVYIVTVPTPVNKNNRPILTPLIESSEMIGKVLKKGDIVIYESTVYPGVTEDECVPILQRISGLKFNEDFFCGYSPERINPGDKNHTLTNIKKVTSGSTKEIGKVVNNLYASIITAGTYLAPSIKVAEAAKVIENAQRDINIAFVNELAKIFNKLDIDTHDVLEAASTKWNFLPFKPGLVGGHCIGVDPYYLAKKAQEVGYHPEIILAGRRLNDGMGDYISTQVLKHMVNKGITIEKAKVLMLGITFKENCTDIRNTKAIDVYNGLSAFNMDVDVYDPWADFNEVKHKYGINLISKLSNKYDAIVHVVAHKDFLQIDLESLKSNNSIVYDVKGALDLNQIDKRL